MASWLLAFLPKWWNDSRRAAAEGHGGGTLHDDLGRPDEKHMQERLMRVEVEMKMMRREAAAARSEAQEAADQMRQMMMMMMAATSGTAQEGTVRRVGRNPPALGVTEDDAE